MVLSEILWSGRRLRYDRRSARRLVAALGRIGLAAGLLAACGTSGKVTGPSRTVAESEQGDSTPTLPENSTATPSAQSAGVTWRGAVITGERPGPAKPLIEQAWQRMLAQLGPGPEPAGWTVLMYATRFPCGRLSPQSQPSSDALCRGTMDTARHRISITWEKGPADVEAIAQWELCNYHRWATTHKLVDGGCTTAQASQ